MRCSIKDARQGRDDARLFDFFADAGGLRLGARGRGHEHLRATEHVENQAWVAP